MAYVDSELHRHVSGVISALQGVAVLTEEAVVGALLRAHVKYQRKQRVGPGMPPPLPLPPPCRR